MDKPSDEAAKPLTVTVKDAQGREIVVRKLKPIERLRLIELVGPDNAMNQPYLGYATMAYAVSKIDGNDLAVPRTKVALEAVIQRLDDDGLKAVGDGLKELFPETDPDETKAELKNE